MYNKRGAARKAYQKKKFSPRKKRLNLRRIDEFKWEINQILSALPENVRGTLKGSIIAKADKIDSNAAIDFIEAKEKEGLIDTEMTDRLCALVVRFTTFR
ncbi:MAG: hypothetical protein HZB92_07120 [Euryarchaeota archaeon]|nr:hypothetical protein [Euryarchaeota archaeon]